MENLRLAGTKAIGAMIAAREKIMALIIAALLLYQLLQFLFGMSRMVKLFSDIHIPHFLIYCIVIVLAGICFELICSFASFSAATRFIHCVLIAFALLFLALQVFLTIGPGLMSCNCIAVKNMTWENYSWGAVGMALLTLACSIFKYKIAKPSMN